MAAEAIFMQSKADSFSAFLEARQKIRASAPATSGTPFSLLFELAKADQKQMSIAQLMAASTMPFTEFADALKNLKESGYLALTGTGSAEVATLTTQGEQVVNLARK